MVELSEIKCIKLAGIQSVWKVNPEDVVKDGDDNEFIRISPTNWTLVKLICDTNPAAPFPTPKNFSLTKSVGLQEMISIRNACQASELEQPTCSLFADEPSKKAKKRKTQLSRAEMLEKRAVAPEAIQITVDEKVLTVLRPVHPTDNIFILYDRDNVLAALIYIRDAGFDEHLSYKHDPVLPKGMWRKADKIIVKFTKPDGAVGYKTCDDVEGATMFLAGVPEDAAEEKAINVEDGGKLASA